MWSTTGASSAPMGVNHGCPDKLRVRLCSNEGVLLISLGAAWVEAAAAVRKHRPPHDVHGAFGHAPVAGGTPSRIHAVRPEFMLMDLNGNARVDIVVTERCNDGATSTTRWLLGRLTCK